MSSQASLVVYGGYEYADDLTIGKHHTGSVPATSGTETGTDTALPIDNVIVPSALPDGGFVDASWSISAATQHFSMSAIAAGYGNDDPTVMADDGYATTTVYVGSRSTDYITNNSAAPVTVKFTYTLNAEAQTGALQEADDRYQIGAVSGTIDLIPTNGSGTGTYEYTFAPGQTVDWATYYTFEGDATWGYDPGVGFTGSDFTYDASSTGHVYADELDGNGNPIANNPDLTFASGVDFSSLACFVSGTAIATADGEIPVERLAVGDLVLAQHDGLARVIWIGRRHVDCHQHPRPQHIYPVRVRAEAFGEGKPGRDLWLSPDHAVFVDGALIPIRHLVNGRTIRQERRGAITYWHIELERHDVLFAEGLPCESYLDSGNRSAFSNGGDVVMAHPDFAGLFRDATACAPLIVCGPLLAAVQARLLACAEALERASAADQPGARSLAG